MSTKKKPSLDYYIAEAGFVSVDVREKYIPGPEFRKYYKAINRILSRVLVPDRSMNLFTRELQMGYPTSFSGYAIYLFRKPILYEFNDFQVPPPLKHCKSSNSDPVLAAYGIERHKRGIKSEKHLPVGIKKHTKETDIIRILKELIELRA